MYWWKYTQPSYLPNLNFPKYTLQATDWLCLNHEQMQLWYAETFLDSNIRIFQCTFLHVLVQDKGHSDQFLSIFVYFILNFLFSSKIRQRYKISQLCLWSSLTAQKSLQWLSQGIQSLSNQAQGVWRRHSGHLGPNWGDYNPCTYHSSWSQKGL